MRPMTRRLSQLLVILVFSGFAGVLLMLGVYLLPITPIRDNIRRGTDVYNREGEMPELAQEYPAFWIDNTTDTTMLNIAAFEGERPLRDALLNPRYLGVEDGELQGELRSFMDYLNIPDIKEEMTEVTYARYWHGYLVPLKALLVFFDFSDIRALNMMTQLGLLIALFFLLQKRGRGDLVPAMFVLIAVINPAATMLCFQYTTCMDVLLLSCILYLALYERWEEEPERMDLLLLGIGIFTAYIDFLTYPLVPPAIVILLYMTMTRKKTGPADAVRLTVCWGIGYVGMWAQKWIYASLLTEENVIMDAAEQILYRTGTHEGKFTLWDVIWHNMYSFLKWPYLILFAGVFFLYLGLYFRRFKQCKKERKMILPQNIAAYLLLTAYPFLWYCFASEHSYMHRRFTCRLLGISVFAVYCMLAKAIRDKRNVE